MSRYLDCQFIIATHSPFMLGTLDSKIYNIDKPDCRVMQWYELENIRYFYNFFQKHKAAFEEALNQSGLKAEECVFIDNTASNLDIPSEMGFTTVYFDDDKRDYSSLYYF